jgi:hypothetical protein
MLLVSDELSGGSHSPIANRSIYISESAGPALHVPSSAEFGDDCNWLMETKAVFYHAGCPVCVDAEQNIAQALDRNRFDIEIIHLGNDKSRLPDAERAGVKSVPALVLDDHAFHINHGADLSALK